MDDTLTDKQRHFVENISCGMPSRAAALAAGYSASFSKVAGHRFRRRPAVVAAVEAIREQGRTLAAYDLAAAMREANDAATFARANKNSMALVKAVELRARLSGLLIDR
jgi:phage terminase small subunit